MKGNISWSLWEFKINNVQNNDGFSELIAILSLEVYESSALRVTGLVTDIHNTCNYNQRQAGNEILDFRTRLDGCNCCTVSFFPPSPSPIADYRKHIHAIMQCSVVCTQIRAVDVFK